jgi:uncharacterized protein YbbK (DUF523 family)
MATPPVARVLVSACLLGERVRYNGAHKRCDDDALRRWIEEGRVIAVCPELAGGLSVPRPPAEITGAAGGAGVLDGEARVITSEADDVAAAFVRGAESALEVAQAHGIRVAVLKEGSPSCGVRLTSDGSFCGVKIDDSGVTAALLRRHRIAVFSEHEIALADAVLAGLSTTAD